MPAKPGNVDEYIESLSGAARQRMVQLRDLALATAPGATETLKWGDPAYVHASGVILFILSGHKTHANFVFTPTTREAFDDELGEYETGKGSVKLPYAQPVPTELLTRMVHHRIQEHEIDGVKWM